MSATAWIGVDWGTTNATAFAFDAHNTLTPRESRSAPVGMGRLKPEEFEPALIRLIGDWLPDDGSCVPVVACGMVGARQGWREAPYVGIPSAPSAWTNATRVPVRDRRVSVWILPGLAQNDPPDVMRGEETQVAGYLANAARPSGLLCLPGTHTKWVVAENGTVRRFRSFMTGELFALLSEHSVLRFSVSGTDQDDDAFLAAVQESYNDPTRVPAVLFALRAGDLLHGLSGASPYARLSGLLIGQEIAAATRNTTTETVAIIGRDSLAARYRMALEILGRSVRLASGERCVAIGLALAYQHVRPV